VARLVLKTPRMQVHLRSRAPRRLGRDTAALILSLLASVVTGCSPSAEDIKKEFTSYVASANSCAAANDCAMVSAPCPLGCWVAVRADRKADVQAKARQLVADYESGGESCDYECSEAGPATCVQGRCSAGP
jgi:hypothetical protein